MLKKPTGLFIDMNTNTLDGADARALKIDSEQKGKVVEIDATEITTGEGMFIQTTNLTTGNSLNIDGGTSATTGSALVVSQNSGDNTARNVMSVTQSNAAAQSAAGLYLDIDTTAGTDARALKIDSEQTTGKVVEIDATEITMEMVCLLTLQNLLWKIIKHRWVV